MFGGTVWQFSRVATRQVNDFDAELLLAAEESPQQVEEWQGADRLNNLVSFGTELKQRVNQCKLTSCWVTFRK